MAKSSVDLQTMLDGLNSWCNRWGLAINETKTKIVHFRNKNVQQTKYNFVCGDNHINVSAKYKYLGLWFTEHIDLGYMASQVSASAHRSLGLLIAKAKCTDFSFECFTKLYDSLVQPIIDYGASIWGHTHYHCIDSVQNRAMRFFLGVPCKTPTSAVIGDMGWLAPQVRVSVSQDSGDNTAIWIISVQINMCLNGQCQVKVKTGQNIVYPSLSNMIWSTF